MDRRKTYERSETSMWQGWEDPPLAYSRKSTFTPSKSKYKQLEPYCLNFLQANLFATVLEETIKEIRILDECNNQLRIIKTMTDMPMLLRRKFSVKEPDTTDELAGIDPTRLGSPEYQLNKLAADRKYFAKVLTDTFISLALNNCYAPLSKAVTATDDLNAYRIQIVEEETRNSVLRKELWKQLRQQRNHYTSVMYDTDCLIDTLRKKVEDAALMTEITGRFIDNWQNARTEQHVEAIAEEEAGPSESIAYYGQRTDHERRVHSEIELLTNIIISETLNKVESWMNKYDKDIEKLDLKIQIKKNDYQNMYDKRVKYEEIIADHKEAIDSWVKFKDEREARRQYVEKMTNSAIVIQAWWRGLLVRLQLGPFTPSKKPKGKGDAKGKEGKKK